MFFKLEKSWGDHQILSYDKNRHKFQEYFQSLFSHDKLDELHLISKDYENNKDRLKEGVLSDKETDLHKKFYQDIKNNGQFKRLYCDLVRDIYEDFFPEEEVIIYQSFPSIRIQFFDSVVVPPHCDSDDIGKHPIGERNFLLPITRMFGTNTLYLESKPRLGDFEGVELEYGNLLSFNGNKCIHYNKQNVENKIRVSLDFRVILLKDYLTYINSDVITETNPREIHRKPTKMVVGGYYQICFKNKIDNMLNWAHVNSLILQSRPNFDENEAKSCYNYMSDFNNFVTEFKQTEQLEKKICEYTNSKYCVMTTSGTSALLCSLIASGITIGDEVIVPNYTMIATVNVIKTLGAVPIIVDVNANTFTLDLDIIKKHVTSKTKAIIHVSLNNRVHNLEDIVEYCNQNSLILIEDAAQSLGVFYKNTHLGNFGKMGCFSLSTPKIISTGQGGFVITNDEIIYKKLISIKNFGRTHPGSDNYENFGLNFKFTDIQAVIGLEQLNKLSNRVDRMQKMYNLYFSELQCINQISIKSKPFDGWLPWFIEIELVDKNQREGLMQFLKNHNIQTRVTYPQINKTSIYYDSNDLPNSKYISEHGLFLPSHTLLTDNEIIFICRCIRMYFFTSKLFFLTLSCYNEKEVTSQWYIPNGNTGLGNMLFQISSALSYCINKNAKLNIIGLSKYLSVENLIKSNTIFRYLDDKSSYNDKNYTYYDINCNIHSINFENKMCIMSYFENFNNFENVKSKIIDLFSPSTDDIKYLTNKYPQILNYDTCSLHIRGGNDTMKLKHNELNILRDRYHKSIDHMINKKFVKTFIVCTNDKTYTESIIEKYQKTDKEFIFSTERDFYDIWLISLIKNNIVSFSTLSWWGSYLNINPDKYIVCSKGNRDDIHYPSWIVL